MPTPWLRKHKRLSSPPENNIRINHQRPRFGRSAKHRDSLTKPLPMLKQKISKAKSTECHPKNAVYRHVSAWDTIKDLTERKSKPSIRIKGGSRSERKKHWPDHFKNLLGANLTEEKELPRIESADALNISIEPFYIEELKAVTSTLKVQKSPGLVNIPALSLQ